MSIRTVLLISLIGLLFSSCEKEMPETLFQSPLIPRPVLFETGMTSFELKSDMKIYVSQNQPEINSIALILANILRPSTGFDIPIKEFKDRNSSGNIYLLLSAAPIHPSSESYQIDVTPQKITVKAHDAEGIYRGVQSLRQLLPGSIELKKKQDDKFIIQSCHIVDYPRFAYRGAMLDVARHFFSVEDVKKYIDLLSLYKINKLHLHLSDDQGWRIEIKSWPNLTTIGGSTEVGGGAGGFYSQEEYKDIVQYAQNNFITIIPEIDLPGHTHAALASYPELNCDGKAPKLYTDTEVGFSSLCIDKDITYSFLKDVIGELASLTPGPYIHIGGDESFATPLDKYIPFIETMQRIVNENGKQMIGWEEIIQSNINSSSISQFWRNDSLAVLATEKDIPIIYSFAKRCYLDMKYDSTTQLGLHWAGYINVQKAYDWNINVLTPNIPQRAILGIEAPLWTETITNIGELEYMAFPRIIGFAEMGWTPNDLRKWEEYKIRLAKHKTRLNNLNVNFFQSKLVPWEDNK